MKHAKKFLSCLALGFLAVANMGANPAFAADPVAPVTSSGGDTVQKVFAVPFSSDGKLALDLYLPAKWKATDSRPTAVFIHGGGWSAGNRTEYSTAANWLAEQGMVAITIDYRLAPGAKWPAQGIDAAQSVWWLRNNAKTYGINPLKIVAIGGSAGGHLAAMLGVAELRDPKTGVSSKVQAIVSLWGPWNLTMPETADQGNTINNLLAVSTDATEASPFFKITSSAPPTLLFHGTNDSVVPYRQSVDACAALVAAKALYCQLVTLNGQGHGLPSDLKLITNPLIQFLSAWKDYVPAVSN
nr:alpha/beta hydrolase [uncultured Rhodoferax sp.]